MVFNRTGSAPAIKDVAVTDGRIAEIGPDLRTSAHEVIEAGGLGLMPGIVDSITHFDAQITWYPCVRPSPALGVTTAGTGNCGFTIAPCKPQHRDVTMRNLTQVEGMSMNVQRRGIAQEFETFPEYLAQLRRQGSAVNIAAYIGHSSLRTYVMGDDAFKRTATPAEVAQMRAVVREAMQAGAVALCQQHVGRAQRRGGNGRCLRGWPMPAKCARWSRRWASAATAFSCCPKGARRRCHFSNLWPPTAAAR